MEHDQPPITAREVARETLPTIRKRRDTIRHLATELGTQLRWPPLASAVEIPPPLLRALVRILRAPEVIDRTARYRIALPGRPTEAISGVDLAELTRDLFGVYAALRRGDQLAVRRALHRLQGH
jgi:hypothetical protein